MGFLGTFPEPLGVSALVCGGLEVLGEVTVEMVLVDELDTDRGSFWPPISGLPPTEGVIVEAEEADDDDDGACDPESQAPEKYEFKPFLCRQKQCSVQIFFVI